MRNRRRQVIAASVAATAAMWLTLAKPVALSAKPAAVLETAPAPAVVPSIARARLVPEDPGKIAFDYVKLPIR